MKKRAQPSEVREIITLDGIKLSLKAPDLDKDGKAGGVESIEMKHDTGLSNVITPTELGESLKELNLDNIDMGTRMSGIDMRARLHWIEAGNVLALDALVALGVLPAKCLAFTRQKKRLSVSIAGKGRQEIVEIVRGKREQDQKSGTSLWDKGKEMFKGGGSG